MAHDIFISYSAKDKVIADAVCSTIENKGVRCWIAPRDILPGMDWGEAIIDAITSSRAMVLLLSSNSNASPQVKREVERAVNKGVVIIPLRIEDVPLSKSLEYHLSTTHWLDALTPPIERHLQTLAEKVRQLLFIPTPTVNENNDAESLTKGKSATVSQFQKEVTGNTKGALKAVVDKDGWAVCPSCKARFDTRNKFFYRGGFHTVCTTKVALMPAHIVRRAYTEKKSEAVSRKDQKTVNVLMPDIKQGKEGEVRKWVKEVGDVIEENDPLAYIYMYEDSEQGRTYISHEILSPYAGTLSEIVFPGGTKNVKINTVIARIELK